MPWPKPYLLEILSNAITLGLLYVEPLTQREAKSLKMSLLRVRRRIDKTSAQFIRPEFHLVTILDWEPASPGADIGRLPIMYDQLPAHSAPLPAITHGNPGYPIQIPQVNGQAPATPIAPAELNIATADISNYVDALRDRAIKKRDS